MVHRERRDEPYRGARVQGSGLVFEVQRAWAALSEEVIPGGARGGRTCAGLPDGKGLVIAYRDELTESRRRDQSTSDKAATRLSEPTAAWTVVVTACNPPSATTVYDQGQTYVLNQSGQL